MPTLLEKIDQERDESRVSAAVEAAKSCRVTLAKSAEKPLKLSWCQGRGFATTLLIVKPGESVVQPIDKCRAWFGPFDLFKVYEETRDEKKLNELREIISTESARYLFRYDYPRTNGDAKKQVDITPSGPHRSPDVTITVLNADGSEDDAIRLYEVYGIGEFDPLQETFAVRETEEQIRARFEAQLRSKDEQHHAEIELLRRQMSEVAGMVKGRLFEQPAAQEPLAASASA